MADFLIRCLFTMFAEDVRLLPPHSFTNLLRSVHARPAHFVPMVKELWDTMRTGGFSCGLCETLLRFNGGLFEDTTALPVSAEQLALLIEACQAAWRDVEPAIFGTLLERALNPRERHQLGAHHTPRANVERLVLPTVIEPLRQEWAAVQAAAAMLEWQDKRQQAVSEIQAFHHRLYTVRVLDPACGTGNFLYVTLEHLKRLEGEVLDALDSLGAAPTDCEMDRHTVEPHQLLGLEVNPRAAAITRLVLWIGYLQWHFRTHGQVVPPQPILKNAHHITCRDALLVWEYAEPVLDDTGQPVTRWDGYSVKMHPVTGETVPDDTVRVPVVRYLHPRQAAWPEAEFVVGNPSFLGNWRMRSVLGDGYAEALCAAYSEMPASCDYVMYWWHQAARLTRTGNLHRFGLITTNSLRQTFNENWWTFGESRANFRPAL